MTAEAPPTDRVAESRPGPELPELSPGDRYYRHPGDVVRVVVWSATSILILGAIGLVTATTDGLTSDLGRAAGRVPEPVRELSLALAQVVVVTVPAAVIVLLALQRRWRRLGLATLAGLAGAAAVMVIGALVDLQVRPDDALVSGGWLASLRFPSLPYLAGLVAAGMVGKPWLARPWRRASDLSLVALTATMMLAGTAGVAELLLTTSVGAAAGAALLVAFGAPNRRPSPSTIAATLDHAGLPVAALVLRRAEGGRSQLYSAVTKDGRAVFVKVYSEDSRDADLLFRAYRTLMLRGHGEDWPSMSLNHDVEHEALLLLLAGRADVSTAELVAVASIADGSMVLVTAYVDGARLDELEPDRIDELLDAVWHEVAALHDAGLAHRSLRAANILVADGRPVVIDLGFGEESATPRLQAIDRAELLVSLACLTDPERVVASAERCLGPRLLAAALPYLQPLALTQATRHRASKSLLHGLKASVESATGQESAPLERLVRVRPRSLLMVATFTAAFYVLLPQLANVDESVRALDDANWAWLAVCIVMSLATYVLSAVAMSGSVPEPLPLGANVEAQMASSFVNRVTPANVGGMALNVRFMQKRGIPATTAITGLGLNTAAGAIVHIALLFLFVAFAGSQNSGFKLPASSTALVIVSVVLAIVGVIAATARGRRLLKTHVIGQLRRAGADIASLGRSPLRLLQLLGGSAGVTLAYISALAAAVAAFHGDATYAQVGAVYLGASIVSAAAPTPGGLGAMEAALIAGLTGLGVDPGNAVASVLGYRLATYWLPILPGWLSFRRLERRDLI